MLVEHLIGLDSSNDFKHHDPKAHDSVWRCKAYRPKLNFKLSLKFMSDV